MIPIFFKFAFIVVVLSCSTAFAQGVTIGANNPPNPAAVLDLQTTNQGFLMPRLTTVQRNAIPNPPIGLQVYNIDTDCIEFYFSQGGWKSISCGCNVFPNASFSYGSATVNNPVTFTPASSGAGYAWTFQSGSPATSTASLPVVTWTTGGTYSVSLTLTDAGGCSATQTQQVNVVNCTPVTYSFSNCTATGMNGPSQSQCNATYGSGVVTVSNGIQSWVVPQSGNYRVVAAGAKGGNAQYGYTGGNGAIIQGDFTFSQGDVIEFIVGQMGTISTDGTYAGGSGGGGSFVRRNGTVILVGGGGGGASGRTSGPDGGAAQTGTSGASAIPHSSQSGNYVAPGGSGGSGGSAGTGNSAVDGAGGGGYSGDGAGSTGGKAYLNGGTGGNGDAHGGFGGGGSSGLTGSGYHGGGGGGYSGGGGGSNSGSASYGQGGGGGASYNLGVNPQSAVTNAGHGYVTISRICP